jgi:Mu-like prophage I protein
MPEILHKCVEEVMSKGHDEQSAYAICRTSLGLKDDGTEDETEPAYTEDEMLQKVALHLNSEFSNVPPLVKEITVARAGVNFVNGEQEFDLPESRIDAIIANTKKWGGQVKVYLEDVANPGHPPRKVRGALPADGWAEALKRVGKDMVAKVKLMGAAAVGVAKDQYRGASIATREENDLHGKPIGEILDHILITNDPFFANLPAISASRSQGGKEAVTYISAQRSKPMADPKNPSVAEIEAKHKTEIEAKELELSNLRKERLKDAARIEDLEAQVSNVKADPEKEELQERLVRLELKSEAQEIREVVNDGLSRGTLKASWAQDFKKGGDTGTIKWFKDSRFGGDLKLLKYQVYETEPIVQLNKRYASGANPDDVKTLSSEDKQWLRNKGIDPDKVAAGKARDLGEYKRLKAEEKGAN